VSAQLNFASPTSTLTVVTAALATIIALGILWGVVILFQSRGAPMERLAAAEHACAQYIYLSERQACMNAWLAASRPVTVARPQRSDASCLAGRFDLFRTLIAADRPRRLLDSHLE